MSRRLTILSFLLGGLLVATAAIAGSLIGRWSFPRTSPQPEPVHTVLQIDSKDLDLGEVWETDCFVWRLEIRNPGPVVREVVSLSKSCECLSLNPTVFSLGPGESRAIELKLRLRNEGKATEPFAVAIWAKIHGESTQPSWTLQGRVRAAYQVSRRVDAGVVPESDQPRTCVEIPLNPLVGLTRIEVRALSPEVDAELRQPAEVSARYRIAVTPRAGLQRGRYSSRLAIAATLIDGTALPENEVEVSFEIAGDIQASPDFAQLGLRKIGDVVRESVVLHSLTGRKFEVCGIRVEGEGLSCNATVKGDSTQYAITQEVRRLGSWSGRVIFDVKGSDGGRTDVILPVEFTGYARE